MEKQLKDYMGNVDEVVTLFKQKVKRIEDDRDALQARCDKYEKALKEILKQGDYYSVIELADKALSSEGKEVENG
jgi:hypothetical protein